MHQLALLFSLMLCPQARHAGAVPHDGAAGATHGPAAAATARAGPQDRPGPVVLEGGRAGSRALLVALHGGSFAGAEALQLAERCRDELHAAARAEGLRLLVPVAPDPETVETVPVEGATDRGTHESGAARPVQGVYQVPWLSAAGEARVLALIDEELAAHRADPARICLAGHGA
ncbi:MAG TPA: hypothetical protein VK824_06330, partial [Planctomycetota bacterium]|nr:hypothetical protein [Planctomycetota bacterium]